MADENFFSRWSRRKIQAKQGNPLPPEEDGMSAAPVAAPAPVRQAPASEPVRPELTLDDVAKLTPDSDFSPFVARGVDEQVQRQAMKKLFADPHFNVMDGLDTYIEDYNKFEPILPEMLAALNHAKSLLDPLSQLEKPLLPILDDTVEVGDAVDNAADIAEDEAAPADDSLPQVAADSTSNEHSASLASPAHRDDAACGQSDDSPTFPEARS
jgi:hypothetical protein